MLLEVATRFAIRLAVRLRMQSRLKAPIATPSQAAALAPFTYFSQADFSPYTGKAIAEALAAQHILVKPLDVPRLEPGFMRMTTAVPEDNAKVLRALRDFFTAHPR
jgi:histidinol-phosphate/aromatic aminotransferase/cobyric acid decarboxylase-like protein